MTDAELRKRIKALESECRDLRHIVTHLVNDLADARRRLNDPDPGIILEGEESNVEVIDLIAGSSGLYTESQAKH